MSKKIQSPSINPILDKINLEPFKPYPLLSHPSIQTIAPVYGPPFFDLPKTQKHCLPLPDGDILVLMENIPEHWQPGDRIVVLIHGLTGSYRSKYNIRLCQDFMQRGFRTIRVNLRGCGPGAGLARYPYHCGRSDDMRLIFNWIVKRFPKSPITLIGISLGGNIALKTLGEEPIAPLPTQVDSGIVVSAPVDLLNSSLLLATPRNQRFDQYFVKGLVGHALECLHHFPELPALNLPKKLNMYEFDDLYTAPRSGFLNALDYYNQCSSGPLLKNIKVPTLILHSKDDPFVLVDKYLPCPENPNIDFVLTEQGGHVGWMGIKNKPIEGIYQWMDALIIGWLAWFTKQN